MRSEGRTFEERLFVWRGEVGLVAIGTAKVSNLHLDLKNPRNPDIDFEDETDALEYLYTTADLPELIQSIGNSGWQNFEPLIVEKPTMTVIEGNRRLGALRILSTPSLQDKLRVVMPSSMHDQATPESISVNFVESRSEARDYIGFKHVNGAFKWDSYAKAKFARDWLNDGESAADVSRRLGDGHNTISRLVNGVVGIKQAEKLKLFDRDRRTKTSFHFSHLYTALSTPNVRRFLGLPENDNSVLKTGPVPTDHRTELQELLSWLFGQDEEPSIIRSQNPNLSQLVLILGSESAINDLRSNRDLARAFELVENKAQAFQKLFYQLVASAEGTLASVAKYDPSTELSDDSDQLLRTIRLLVAGIKDRHSSPDGSDEA